MTGFPLRDIGSLRWGGRVHSVEMRWVYDTDLAAFAGQALPWAQKDPVVNNVLYTVVESRLSGAIPVEPGAVWARCLDGDELHAVAIRTPPHPLLVSPLSDAAAQALAEELPDVPALTGTAPAVATVRRHLRRPAELTMAMRIYALHQVRPPTAVPGVLRQADAGDESLACAWTQAFCEEAGLPAEGVEQLTRSRVAAGRLWFWDVDDQPATFVSAAQPAAGVVRVGPVYTPSEQRRHGFASACVAAVSQLALDSGAERCMLYTDLANATSNSIYQAVGYQPVNDAETWTFLDS